MVDRQLARITLTLLFLLSISILANVLLWYKKKPVTNIIEVTQIDTVKFHDVDTVFYPKTVVHVKRVFNVSKIDSIRESYNNLIMQLRREQLSIEKAYRDALARDSAVIQSLAVQVRRHELSDTIVTPDYRLLMTASAMGPVEYITYDLDFTKETHKVYTIDKQIGYRAGIGLGYNFKNNNPAAMLSLERYSGKHSFGIAVSSNSSMFATYKTRIK